MDNVIEVPFHPMQQMEIVNMHYAPDGTFKSANEIAKATGLRVSVIKAILKRGKKYVLSVKNF